MEYINFDQNHTIQNIDTTWVGIMDVINNIANVKIGNSEIIISVPISSNDITQSIKNYFNI